MRPFATTISLDEALAILRQSALPIDRIEQVPLADGDGRVLASDILATADVPPFDRAAMDGYAVIAADTAAASHDTPVSLRVVGTLFTGQESSLRVARGECVTIATGAPLPPGADAVVMVEHTVLRNDSTMDVHTAVRPRQHVGARAGDIAAGQQLLPAGTLLGPARLGALAALGLTSVPVFARPRVFVASTGNEIVAPGVPLAPGQIYDINRYTLVPVIARHGGEAIVGATVEDSIEALRRSLDDAAAAGADILVLSGGSSVGDRDLLVDAVMERGDVLFHGIAVKPGKPTLLARIGSSLLLGMPGNPTSCLSNAYVLLAPLLRLVARLPAWRPERREVPLAASVKNTSGRFTFYTVRIENGQAVAAFKGSGEITSLAHADGYIEIPAEVTEILAGTLVTVTLVS
jgi:molybdenum cofactor synthesis domain-containing protein